MKASIRTLWQHHRYLVIGFMLALMLTSVFAVRTMIALVYWPQHRDADISGWMTVGYVAHSYDVDKDGLIEALGIEADLRRHLTLKAIADGQDMTMVELRNVLLKAVIDQRATSD